MSSLTALSRAEQRLALLQELAEIGMGLARGAAAKAAETGDAEAALTFARLSRAVRQTLALEVRFEQEALSLRGRVLGARGARVKREAARLVTEAIDAGHSCEFEADGLIGELNERLADEDDCDFADKPLLEVVQRLCRDLGVPFDPDLWEDVEDEVDTPPLPRRSREGEGRERADIGLNPTAMVQPWPTEPPPFMGSG